MRETGIFVFIATFAQILVSPHLALAGSTWNACSSAYKEAIHDNPLNWSVAEIYDSHVNTGAKAMTRLESFPAPSRYVGAAIESVALAVDLALWLSVKAAAWPYQELVSNPHYNEMIHLLEQIEKGEGGKLRVLHRNVETRLRTSIQFPEFVKQLQKYSGRMDILCNFGDFKAWKGEFEHAVIEGFRIYLAQKDPQQYMRDRSVATRVFKGSGSGPWANHLNRMFDNEQADAATDNLPSLSSASPMRD